MAKHRLRIFLVMALGFSMLAEVSLAQDVELVVQTGQHNSLAIALSPDRRTLASGDGNGNIKLSDVASGRELRTLRGRRNLVNSLAFSPDGKTLAAAGWEATISLWDIGTGLETRRLVGADVLSLHFKPIAFSPDGKTVASGCADKTVKLWDAVTGAVLKTLGAGTSYAAAVGFSPDGKTLVAGSDDGTVNVWDIALGRLARTMKGQVTATTSLVFSPDGRLVAAAGYDQPLQLLNLSSGQRSSGTIDSPVELWDVSSGEKLKTLAGNAEKITDMIIATPVRVKAMAFSPDSKTLATGTGNRIIKLWDIDRGTERKTLSGHTSYIEGMAFSSDGETLISGSLDGAIIIWNVARGEGLRSLRAHTPYIHCTALSADGKTIASGNSDGTIKLWNTAGGAGLKTLRAHDNVVASIVFSPDGKLLASGSLDGIIKLWDVASGEPLTAFADARPTGGGYYLAGSMTFSPDGATLASGSSDGTIRLLEVGSGKELKRLEGRGSYIESNAFSPDGATLASGRGDGIIKLWDVVSSQELKTLQGHTSAVEVLAFSTDGTVLASKSREAVKTWDIATGKEEGSYPPRDVEISREIAAIVPDLYRNSKSRPITPDGRFQLAVTDNSEVDLYEAASGRRLVSLIAIDDSDWLVTTPEGFFDGTPLAWKQLIWRFNNNTFAYAPVEAFFREFYYPGLLSDIVAGKRVSPPRKTLSAVDIRQPQVRIALVGGKAVGQTAFGQPATFAERTSDRQVEVTLEITDNHKAASHTAQPKTSGAQDVRLFRNGSLVKLWPGDALAKTSKCQQLPVQDPSAPRRSLCTVTVTIVAGENRLTAYAFNSDNVKSSDAILILTGADTLRRKGVAYVLAVGVNQYANARYNLNYAVADARDFAAELKRQQQKLGNYEHVEVTSLSDKDATKTNILKVLGELPGKIQPEDALVIFFAGHGTAQRSRFFLIPHDLGYDGNPKRLDEAGLQTMLSHSISDEELGRAIEGIDAGQLLLVIDACNSGQALEAEEKRRGPMNSKGLAQLAYEKGMYILTAAQSYQAALEASKLGHGYLTYVLVEEGLKTPAADFEPKDNQLLLREWLDYATNRVPQMQQELIDKGERGIGLKVVFVEGDEKIKDPSKRNLQHPRAFYRRETETTPLVVAKP